MTEQDAMEFAACLKVAADVYGRPGLPVEAVKLYMLLLRDFSLAQVRYALQEHMKVSPFMPKPADLIKILRGSLEERTARAWAEVLEAVRKLGPYESVRFSSPATHYALMRMGGWESLCERLTVDNENFKARDFAVYYALGEKAADWDRVPAYFASLYERHNRLYGYDFTQPIHDMATGGYYEPKELESGLKNKRGQLRALGEILNLAEDRGFEPLEARASTDFKSAAIDHSASPPY